MTGEISVEATGETVGEAKWAAVRELERLLPGLDRAAVRFEIVAEGERGLLGVGYTPARVVATAPTPEQGDARPADGESEQAAQLRELLRRVTDAIGVACTIRIDESDDTITGTLAGGELGIVIGRHGQTIDAIQYLANAVAHRDRGPERKPVVVDAADYRARRTATVEGLAQRSAERAAATGQPVTLEPMTAVERKIVHEFLKDDPEVETASEGTEPNRCVVISPRSGPT
jgi:spoIIIJ-associated protein